MNIAQILIYLKKFQDSIVHVVEKSVPTIWILKCCCLFSVRTLLFLL